VGFAAIRESMDSSVKSAKFLATEMALPVLASIPEIVTWGDRRRERILRIALPIALVVVVITGIAVFHFYVMDLDILWVKVLKNV
jgi:polysaccharide biosynthesis transport protein